MFLSMTDGVGIARGQWARARPCQPAPCHLHPLILPLSVAHTHTHAGKKAHTLQIHTYECIHTKTDRPNLITHSHTFTPSLCTLPSTPHTHSGPHKHTHLTANATMPVSFCRHTSISMAFQCVFIMNGSHIAVGTNSIVAASSGYCNNHNQPL